MDVLIEQNYAFELFTSARFSYPEFDKTLYRRIPVEHLHEAPDVLGWKSDRINTEKRLDFLRNRDRSRPFMTFEFFESAHARYCFPEESVIRRPYLEDFNYATADIQKDIELIRNRYINSCRHLDSQIARVLEYLESENLLDSTLVVIAGDHGEEFMEKGRWGHNSEFTEEQIRVPMVLWIPGENPAEHARMTSHLDLPATLLPLLGLKNSEADYTLGRNMLAGSPRDHVVLADWDRLCYVDRAYKATWPFAVSVLTQTRITDATDRILADPSEFILNRPSVKLRRLQESSHFLKR